MKLVFRSCVLFVCLLVLQTSAFAVVLPTTCPWTPAVIDGVLSPAEWDAAYTFEIQVNLPGGGTEPARVYVMNDATTLYVALQLKHPMPVPRSSFFVKLDADRDGRPFAGDDLFGINPELYKPAIDAVYFIGGSCPPGVICSAFDVDRGGTNDVTVGYSADGVYMTFELAKPLMVDDPNDAAMPVGSSIGMAFSLRLINANNVIADTFYPLYGYGPQYLISDCGPVRF